MTCWTLRRGPQRVNFRGLLLFTIAVSTGVSCGGNGEGDDEGAGERGGSAGSSSGTAGSAARGGSSGASSGGASSARGGSSSASGGSSARGGSSSTTGGSSTGGSTLGGVGGSGSGKGGSTGTSGAGADAGAGMQEPPGPGPNGQSPYEIPCSGDTLMCGDPETLRCLGIRVGDEVFGYSCSNECQTDGDCSDARSSSEAQAECVEFVGTSYCLLVCKNQDVMKTCPDGMYCYAYEGAPLGYCLTR